MAHISRIAVLEAKRMALYKDNTLNDWSIIETVTIITITPLDPGKHKRLHWNRSLRPT